MSRLISLIFSLSEDPNTTDLLIIVIIINLLTVGPTRECKEWSCNNGGRCVQEWDSYYCDCDLTTFTGPTCSDGMTDFLMSYTIIYLIIVYYRAGLSPPAALFRLPFPSIPFPALSFLFLLCPRSPPLPAAKRPLKAS